MAYFHLDRYDDALAACQAALALQPDNAAAFNGIGRVYYHIGPPADAAAAYRRAIDLDPHYVDPYYGLGILYVAKLGDYEAAIAAFRLRLERSPAETWLYAGISTALRRDGRFEEARATLEQLARLDPADGHPP